MEDLHILCIARRSIIVDLLFLHGIVFLVVAPWRMLLSVVHLLRGEIVAPLSLLCCMALVGLELVCCSCCKVDADSTHVAKSIFIKVIRINISKVRFNLHRASIGSISSAWLSSIFILIVKLDQFICLLTLIIDSLELI